MWNKFILEGDTFMPEMHFRQLELTYSAWEPFTETRIQKLKKEKGDTHFIYKNELVKTCFQHNMAFGDVKYLSRRTASDKILFDKAFKIARDTKYVAYQRGLRLVVYKSLDKKAGDVQLTYTAAGTEIGENQ